MERVCESHIELMVLFHYCNKIEPFTLMERVCESHIELMVLFHYLVKSL